MLGHGAHRLEDRRIRGNTEQRGGLAREQVAYVSHVSLSTAARRGVP
jgi:hypothetical protein